MGHWIQQARVFFQATQRSIEKLHTRKQLVRISDSSSGCWETVRQNESNPITIDSEDESKIYKAERQALKKRKSSRSKRSTRTSTSSTSPFPHVWDQTTPQPGNSQPFNRWRLFRGRNNAYSNSNVGNYGAVPGPCFACGEFHHFRWDCLYLRASADQGEQSRVTVNK